MIQSSHGQDCVLHSAVSTLEPEQGKPVPLCGGLSHERDREVLPPSHDWLQGNHDPQAPQPPGTETRVNLGEM